MRLALSSLLVLPLLSVASASSQVFLSSPQVYLHPTPPSSSSSAPPPTLSEEQAQAVIGHHLGASKHHQLPALGDWTKLLGVGHLVVGHPTSEDKAKVLVVQGVGYPQDFAPPSKQPTFVLDPLASTTEFLAPFLSEAHSFLTHALKALSDLHLPKFMLDIFDMLPTEAAHALKQELETLSSWAEGLIPSKEGGESFDALEVKGLEGVTYGGEEYEAAAGVVKGAVAQMTASQTPFILILLPPASANSHHLVARQKKHDPIPAESSIASAASSLFASVTSSVVGSTLSAQPSSSSAARASSSSIARVSSSSVARASSSVVRASTSSVARASSSSAARASSTGRPAPTASNVTQYLGTVFSTSLCLTSKDACEEYTNGCGGKGQCGETKRAGMSCWTCSCGVTRDDKTGADVKWSGVACEKRDISEIFVLIVLTTVLIGAITIGAIGLLYTVGAAPLPSVLTAGGVPGKKE